MGKATRIGASPTFREGKSGNTTIRKMPPPTLVIMLRESGAIFMALALSLLPYAICYGPHHPRGAHQHYKPSTGSNPMKDMRLLRDEEHIKEDLSNLAAKVDTKNMTPEELEFHYFKVHDFDNNTKLDGLEILQAIRHTLHNDERGAASNGEELQNYIDLIDRVLEEDDLDRDGYLSYVEYVIGRERGKRS